MTRGSDADKGTGARPPGLRWWSNLLGKLNRSKQDTDTKCYWFDERWKFIHILHLTGNLKSSVSLLPCHQGQKPFSSRQIKYRCRENRVGGENIRILFRHFTGRVCVACVAARGPPTIHKDIKLKEARLDLSCDHPTRGFVGLTMIFWSRCRDPETLRGHILHSVLFHHFSLYHTPLLSLSIDWLYIITFLFWFSLPTT